MLVSIIPIELQKLTPVLLSLTATTNMQTNSFLNVSNRPQPSANEVNKSIDTPQFSASAPEVVELMAKMLLLSLSEING